MKGTLSPPGNFAGQAGKCPKERLVIKGGHRLEGTVRTSGSKNAALPILAATLLSESTCEILNVPLLEDIRFFISLLHELGTDTSASFENRVSAVTVDASSISGYEAPHELVRLIRASILVLGPLIARIGRARVSMPGGCAIGNRPINLHLKGLELMGAEYEVSNGFVDIRTKGLGGARIYLDFPSVTCTENLLMAAVLARGTTVIENAAREPEIVDLAKMLKNMGARISGEGSDTLKIEGVRYLGGTRWSIIPDRIEAGTYIMAAGAAGGTLEITDTVPSHLDSAISKLRAAGMKIDCSGDSIFVESSGRLKSVDVITQPYPGFPTDLQAQFMVLMCLAQGLSVITENIFENRFMHVAELKRLGADIKIEGRSAIIRGVKKFTGAPVQATDLRASACLVLAGLAARGVTEITDIHHLDRGYENMEAKLAALGADIKRINA